jgi:hypothetical protein
MALNGSGIRDTARVLRISPTTVIAVLKKPRRFTTPTARWYHLLVHAAAPSASNSVALPRCARARSARLWPCAHTILVSVYHRLKNQQPYQEWGADFLDRRHADQLKRSLLKRLERLGVVVTIQSMESTSALPP